MLMQEHLAEIESEYSRLEKLEESIRIKCKSFITSCVINLRVGHSLGDDTTHLKLYEINKIVSDINMGSLSILSVDSVPIKYLVAAAYAAYEYRQNHLL